MSKHRQPFHWEPQLQERVNEDHVWTPPVVLPIWSGGPATGGEHPNARYAMEDIARRHMEQARSQGLSDYTYDTAMEVGRKAAYRHDDKNN